MDHSLINKHSKVYQSHTNLNNKFDQMEMLICNTDISSMVGQDTMPKA